MIMRSPDTLKTRDISISSVGKAQGYKYCMSGPTGLESLAVEELVLISWFASLSDASIKYSGLQSRQPLCGLLVCTGAQEVLL
jgi:hypothetical protein